MYLPIYGMSLKRCLNLRTPVLMLQQRFGSRIPELTQHRHNVQRGNYAVINNQDLTFFENILGSRYVLQDDIQGYNIDWLGTVRGESKVVLKPGSSEEVSAILKYCNKRKIAVCPQGGNTGLVGGSVPVFDEVVLSLQRLNKVISIDELTGVAVCEAGCILENLDNEIRNAGFLVPLDLGAKSSCQIGGNLSTNAGGLRVIRYGNLHGSVLGLETVLANGEILNLLSKFKKDNTGYHLKHLFIGSEGTLGVITKVSILCPAAPSSVYVAFLGLNSFEDVLKIFKKSKQYLGEILSSCEMMDATSYEASVDSFKLKAPISGYPFYMIIETSGNNHEHDLHKINKFLEVGMESGEIVDGTVSGAASKIQDIWKIRELVPVALTNDGYCFKYDISLPLRDFYNIVHVMRERCGNLATKVCGYGHIGDSNLHLNVACKEFTPEIYKQVEPFVYEYTAKLNGSISAEHGVGFLKTKYLKYSKSPDALIMMTQIKNIMDPNKILNPYKVLL